MKLFESGKLEATKPGAWICALLLHFTITTYNLDKHILTGTKGFHPF